MNTNQNFTTQDLVPGSGGISILHDSHSQSSGSHDRQLEPIED